MPPAIRTLDDAWRHFVHRALTHAAEDEPGEAAVAEDEAVAAFVLAHPGAFEARLLAGIGELAALPGPDEVSCLDILLGIHPAGPFAATLRALDPVAILDFCARANWAHERDRAALLAGRFLESRRVDAATASRLSPEMRDAIAGPPLPDILPTDLEGMTPQDIEAAFEAYTGAPITAIEARLRPGGSSFSGFLAAGERLGEIIARDARRLCELGVDRRELAARLARACASNSAYRHAHRSWCDAHPLAPESGPEAADSGLEVKVVAYDGYQQDPFHTLWIHLCDVDFSLRDRRFSGGPVVRGSPLTLILIRRACFFEGSVPHRIDPEVAARMVGLLP